MVRTYATTGEHSSRMLKKAAFSPAQPRRAKTRRSAGKAAVPQLTLVSRFTLLWNDARTPLADFFSILLDDEEGEAGYAKSAGHLALLAFNR